jgi:hypothetical protein
VNRSKLKASQRLAPEPRAVEVARGGRARPHARDHAWHKASGRGCAANIAQDFSIEKSGKPVGRESAIAGLEIADLGGCLERRRRNDQTVANEVVARGKEGGGLQDQLCLPSEISIGKRNRTSSE